MNHLTLYSSLGSQPGRAVKTLMDIGTIPYNFIKIDVSKK